MQFLDPLTVYLKEEISLRPSFSKPSVSKQSVQHRLQTIALTRSSGSGERIGIVFGKSGDMTVMTLLWMRLCPRGLKRIVWDEVGCGSTRLNFHNFEKVFGAPTRDACDNVVQ